MTIYETLTELDADELEYPELYETLTERAAKAAARKPAAPTTDTLDWNWTD